MNCELFLDLHSKVQEPIGGFHHSQEEENKGFRSSDQQKCNDFFFQDNIGETCHEVLLVKKANPVI